MGAQVSEKRALFRLVVQENVTVREAASKSVQNPETVRLLTQTPYAPSPPLPSLYLPCSKRGRLGRIRLRPAKKRYCRAPPAPAPAPRAPRVWRGRAFESI